MMNKTVKEAKPKKVKVTYLSHRGTYGYENFYPEFEIFTLKDSDTFQSFAGEVTDSGLWLSIRNPAAPLQKYVPPSAIIEIAEYEP